jgi:hypothetical protein
VQIETATLLALVAAPLAVVAFVGALAVVLLAGRGRRSLEAGSQRIDALEPVARERLAGARISLGRVTDASAELRAQGRKLDQDLITWAATLAEQRGGVERLSRGKLGPAVRAMQVAGALARVALLWRMPAR